MPPSEAQASGEFANLRAVEPTARDEQTAELEQQEARLARALADEQDDKNKKRYHYANIFVWIALGWLIFVGLIVISTGFADCPFSLSDRVVMLMLGTATVNVLAPAILLAKYLFSNQPYLEVKSE